MFVIGSRGFLGSYLVRAAAGDFEVIEGNRTTTGEPGEVKIDVSDEGSVKAAFQAARPDVVMLLAAIADIDRCQQFPQEAKSVNLRGAEHVANACAGTNARLLFTSTGAVFDGRTHGYTEESPVSPVSVYGETKAVAERSVLALAPSAIVIRIALALGFAQRAGTNGVLDTMRERWASGQAVALPVSEQRNPIDGATLSRFMLELVKQEARGIFHIGCQDPITRYDLGLRLADRMGFKGQVDLQLELPRGRAPRGPDHYLLTDKLRMTNAIPIPSCDQVIERCFDGLA
jgi:dTDP-4-dehydrorhamnose reductase